MVLPYNKAILCGPVMDDKLSWLYLTLSSCHPWLASAIQSTYEIPQLHCYSIPVAFLNEFLSFSGTFEFNLILSGSCTTLKHPADCGVPAVYYCCKTGDMRQLKKVIIKMCTVWTKKSFIEYTAQTANANLVSLERVTSLCSTVVLVQAKRHRTQKRLQMRLVLTCCFPLNSSHGSIGVKASPRASERLFFFFSLQNIIPITNTN